MNERADTLDIFTITAGTRTIGIANAEIGTVLTGRRALEQNSALLDAARAAGRFFTLDRLLCRAAGAADTSVLVIRSPDGTDLFLGFSGVMDVTHVAVGDIRTVPPLVRARQRPFVIWGFCGRGESALMLVTFQYLSQEGAS
jgi:hypothetical protein